ICRLGNGFAHLCAQSRSSRRGLSRRHRRHTRLRANLIHYAFLARLSGSKLAARLHLAVSQGVELAGYILACLLKWVRNRLFGFAYLIGGDGFVDLAPELVA